MRRRGAIVEHPFGTLKCRAGYRHFLVRGFNKVRGEWSLMALCYNFSRVLTIIGLNDLIAYFAKRAADLSLLRLSIGLTAALDGLIALLAQFCIATPQNRPPASRRWNLAA
ncbi:MAG TPA: transposase [Xanthobacteraceae bacterium]